MKSLNMQSTVANWINEVNNIVLDGLRSKLLSKIGKVNINNIEIARPLLIRLLKNIVDINAHCLYLIRHAVVSITT